MLMRELERIRQLAARPVVNAVLTAAAVFLALYLAVGFGLYGLNWQSALIWPYALSVWSLWRAELMTLAAFAGVVSYVYWLKLRVLVHGPARLRALEAEADNRLRQMSREWESRIAAAEEAVWTAEQARKRAESRAADAESRARAARQQGSAGASAQDTSGGEEKFRAAKRAFARLYHPDNVRSDGLDKMIRTEIFKEYWRELEQIQRDGGR